MLSREQAWGWQEFIVMAATRYCLGRQTYIVGDAVDWLVKCWGFFSDKTRSIVKRDLEEYFDRDDRARAAGDSYLPLGADFDRRAWERVRALWGGGDVAAKVEPLRGSVEWHWEQVGRGYDRCKMLEELISSLKHELGELNERQAVRVSKVAEAVRVGLSEFDEDSVHVGEVLSIRDASVVYSAYLERQREVMSGG